MKNAFIIEVRLGLEPSSRPLNFESSLPLNLKSSPPPNLDITCKTEGFGLSEVNEKVKAFCETYHSEMTKFSETSG